MSEKSKEKRDWAGDIISNQNELLKNFKIRFFSVLKYKPWINDADLIEFLNKYRKFNNTKIFKTINNKD